MGEQDIKERNMGTRSVTRRLAASIITEVAFGVIFAGLLTAPVQAQSAVAGQGVMGPGQVVPFAAQSDPPVLTPEQRRLREEMLDRTHLPGPPLPGVPGAVRQSP